MNNDSLNILFENISKLSKQTIPIPFYEKIEFWITVLLAIASIFYSIKAFIEAKKAKQAASEAGKTVKIQTITIELSELIQKLDSLEMNIQYQDARNLFISLNRKISRITASFQDDVEYKNTIKKILAVMLKIKKSLNEVKPIENTPDTDFGFSVYNAIESHLSELSGFLSELQGLFEKRTIEKT